MQNVKSVEQLTPRQGAEYERAKSIVVFRPELAVFMNSLHPAGSLFECPISTRDAEEQHAAYQRRLEQLGVRVFNVLDVMRSGWEDEWCLNDLRVFAASRLTYSFP